MAISKTKTKEKEKLIKKQVKAVCSELIYSLLHSKSSLTIQEAKQRYVNLNKKEKAVANRFLREAASVKSFNQLEELFTKYGLDKTLVKDVIERRFSLTEWKSLLSSYSRIDDFYDALVSSRNRVGNYIYLVSSPENVLKSKLEIDVKDRPMYNYSIRMFYGMNLSEFESLIGEKCVDYVDALNKILDKTINNKEFIDKRNKFIMRYSAAKDFFNSLDILSQWAFLSRSADLLEKTYGSRTNEILKILIYHNQHLPTQARPPFYYRVLPQIIKYGYNLEDFKRICASIVSNTIRVFDTYGPMAERAAFVYMANNVSLAILRSQLALLDHLISEADPGGKLYPMRDQLGEERYNKILSLFEQMRRRASNFLATYAVDLRNMRTFFDINLYDSVFSEQAILGLKGGVMDRFWELFRKDSVKLIQDAGIKPYYTFVKPNLDKLRYYLREYDPKEYLVLPRTLITRKEFIAEYAYTKSSVQESSHGSSSGVATMSYFGPTGGRYGYGLISENDKIGLRAFANNLVTSKRLIREGKFEIVDKRVKLELDTFSKKSGSDIIAFYEKDGDHYTAKLFYRTKSGKWFRAMSVSYPEDIAYYFGAYLDEKTRATFIKGKTKEGKLPLAFCVAINSGVSLAAMRDFDKTYELILGKLSTKGGSRIMYAKIWYPGEIVKEEGKQFALGELGERRKWEIILGKRGLGVEFAWKKRDVVVAANYMKYISELGTSVASYALWKRDRSYFLGGYVRDVLRAQVSEKGVLTGQMVWNNKKFIFSGEMGSLLENDEYAIQKIKRERLKVLQLMAKTNNYASYVQLYKTFLDLKRRELLISYFIGSKYLAAVQYSWEDEKGERGFECVFGNANLLFNTYAIMPTKASQILAMGGKVWGAGGKMINIGDLFVSSVYGGVLISSEYGSKIVLGYGRSSLPTLEKGKGFVVNVGFSKDKLKDLGIRAIGKNVFGEAGFYSWKNTVIVDANELNRKGIFIIVRGENGKYVLQPSGSKINISRLGIKMGDYVLRFTQDYQEMVRVERGLALELARARGASINELALYYTQERAFASGRRGQILAKLAWEWIKAKGYNASYLRFSLGGHLTFPVYFFLR